MVLQNIINRLAGGRRRSRGKVDMFLPDLRQEEGGKVVVSDSRPAEVNQGVQAAQAFQKLVERLDGLNENLGRQANASSELAERVDRLPDMLANMSGINECQQKMIETLLENMKDRSDRERELVEAIDRIPAETARQTEELSQMREKMSDAIDADVSMRRHFDKFIAVLDRMDNSTTDQSDSIKQMQRTFAASDRYLKYLILKQNKRIMWVFATAMGVCLFALGALAAVVAYIVSH